MNNEKENKDLPKGHDKGELANSSKGSSSDTSNSLSRDKIGDVKSDKITPQGRTDNEQDEQRKNK